MSCVFYRRDSFITHRAFCDALAQETERMPPVVGASMYGSGGMALGLSRPGVASQLQSTFQDQSHSSGGAGISAICGNGAAAQFEHLMQLSALGSPRFRPTQQPTSSSPSPFYLGGADDGQTQPGGHTSLMLHGKPAFHGVLMQPPGQHGQPNDSSLLNLEFFAGAASTGQQDQDPRLVFPDQFNGAAAGNSRGGHGSGSNNTERATIFSGNMMGAGGTSFSSLYNSSETVAPPQMSATALLQKAAQMGATTSGGGGVNSMLRGLGIGGGALNGRSYTGAGFMAGESSSSRSMSQAEDESQFRDLMNTLADSGSGGGPGGAVFGGGFHGVSDSKLSTRDFLGVGVVRSMSGAAGAGLPLRHGAAGVGMGSLDPEMK